MTIKYLTGIAVLIVLTAIAQSKCPDGWTTFQASCYHFGHGALTFLEAEQYCVHYGAHLVHINSLAESTFLKSYLSDLKDPKHWIGLKDDIIEGRWTWYDNDTIATFTDWYPGEPNQGKNANCAAIWGTIGYHWVDEPCTNHFMPVCEKRYLSYNIIPQGHRINFMRTYYTSS